MRPNMRSMLCGNTPVPSRHEEASGKLRVADHNLEASSRSWNTTPAARRLTQTTQRLGRTQLILIRRERIHDRYITHRGTGPWRTLRTRRRKGGGSSSAPDNQGAASGGKGGG